MSCRSVNIGTTDMSDEKRQYRMKRRAEQEAQTRQRITESAVELHGSLGPARTSMKAVAEHRKRGRAARQSRPPPDLDEGRRRARGGPTRDRLPPLRRRGGAVRCLLC